MNGIDLVIATCPGLTVVDVTEWVDRGWVQPERGESGAFLFRDIDVARCRLIRELRDDLGLDQEVMPTVLGLLDQVYDLRRTLGSILRALDHQPMEVRAAVLAAIPPR